MNLRLLKGIIFAIFIVGLSLGIGALTHSPVQSKAPLTSVALSGNDRVAESSPAVADFDGDGLKEIVVGSIQGNIYVISNNGSSWNIVWQRQVIDDMRTAGASTSCVNTENDGGPSYISSSPAIGDIDNDGKLDLVVATGGAQGGSNRAAGGIIAYNFDSTWNFSVKSGWPQPKVDVTGSGAGASNPDGCWDGFWAAPVLGDLDNDNDLEIITSGLDRAIHAWHHDGSYVTGWPLGPDSKVPSYNPILGNSRGSWSTPALADMNEDGFLDVIVGFDGHITVDTTAGGGGAPYHLVVLNRDGTLHPGFPVSSDETYRASPAIGDVDGDGHLDIVIGTGGVQGSGENNASRHYVYAWDRMGNNLPGWPVQVDDKTPSSPALANLDNDPQLEVVVGCGRLASNNCRKVYAFDHNGTNLPNFPVDVPVSVPFQQFNFSFPPVIADYDGDNEVEILISSFNSNGPTVINKDGSIQPDATLNEGGLRFNAPVVDDVDNDGKLEVIAASNLVYIWDVNGNADGQLPWPMAHQNAQRTGSQLPDPKPELVCISDVTILHAGTATLPTATGDIILTNTGEESIKYTLTHAIAALTAPTSGTTGTFTAGETIALAVDTTGLGPNTNLGSITITTEDADGNPVEGCSEQPQTVDLRVIIGDISNMHLPVVVR